MKLDLTSTDDHERYWVRQSVEVERILREVCRTGGLVSLYGENGRDFSLTRIVDVDAGTKHVWLDYGPDENVNTRLAASRTATLSSSQDGVHIQFTVSTPEKVMYKSGHAWRMSWPDRILRLQRREYYRLSTSLVHPIRCLIKASRGVMETTVMDISVGGMAVLAYEGGHVLEAGQIFHGCRLTLPDMAGGEISFSLRVINTFDMRLKNGRMSHRAGCEFVDLPTSVETEIQRYILKTERERRSRYI